MTVIKYPMSLNDDDQAKIGELVRLMGISGVYGDFAKAVKFGISLGLSAIKNPEKVYSTLTGDEMGLFFQAVKNAEESKRKLEEAEKLQKEALKV